ncbi:LacI family DNA-binding transcriptional regulator [Streptomyces sp. NPDC020490]|uniref:LacI family DNA-binding transcriptional regulator n=1 Tax=Streptomyces sp. NPDC020490 TaxID=3365078 RepID=UPI00378EB17E
MAGSGGGRGKQARKPVIKDVAQHAGVAPSSVSRALSGHPSVSASLRAKVMASAHAVGYTPDLLAQALRRQRSKTVGFVVSDISNPLISEIVSGAEQRLRQAEYSLLLTNSEGQAERDEAHIRLLERRRVDGLLLLLSSEEHPQTVAALEERVEPVVLIDRQLDGEIEGGAVLSDHASGMLAAVQHLFKIGHTRIGLMVGRNVRPAKERVRALKQAYDEAGIPPRYALEVNIPLDADRARAATRRLVEPPNACTALIVGSNQLLPWALSALRDLGLQFGRDLAVVTCDRTAVTDVIHPEIAAVHRDNRAVGYQAADLLLALLNGEAPHQVLLPTEFSAGETCCPPH